MEHDLVWQHRMAFGFGASVFFVQIGLTEFLYSSVRIIVVYSTLGFQWSLGVDPAPLPTQRTSQCGHRLVKLC